MSFFLAVPRCMAFLVLGIAEALPPTQASTAATASGSRLMADGIGLLQESVQIASRSAEAAVTPAEGPRAKDCGCAGLGAGEAAQLGCGAGADTSAHSGASKQEPEGSQLCFLQRFIKPHRLKTVGIAVIGFGLLTLDSAPAMLLAI
mmetsp:Transcript_12928/g.40633  ORF Transcript_12928/g.40633 Transcript_12928/m.40633 type:complete len:147 (-) Transcript_12928:80-520(-)